MLINDKLYKLVNGEIVELTTDDIPEGDTNKYSAGGFEQLVAVLPWDPVLESQLAYEVSDGVAAYSVTTGPYTAYEVSDGDTVYEISSGDYTSYQVSDGEKAYEISTGNYTAYEVSDGATVYTVTNNPADVTVYQVTNGPAAYAVSAPAFTSYQVTNTSGVIRYVAEAADYTALYNEPELISVDSTSYDEAFTYTGTNEEITLTGYADGNELTNSTLYTNIELTVLMSFGYRQKSDFTLTTGEQLNGVVLYTNVQGSTGETASGTLYTDNTFTTPYQGEGTFKYTGTTSAGIQVTCYTGTAGESGASVAEGTAIYSDQQLQSVYTNPVYTNFTYTGDVVGGNTYYTEESGTGNLTTQKIYSDTLLREEVLDVDVTAFSWTGESVADNIQTCYTDTNTDIANASFYTTNKLTEEYVVKGAKTKSDFTLTGNEFFGHTGYATSAIIFAEVFSDVYLRTVLTFDVADYAPTGVTQVVSQTAYIDFDLAQASIQPDTIFYTDPTLEEEYGSTGAIAKNSFQATGTTYYGHTGYVATNSAIDTIYSDALLTMLLNEGQLADFEYTGEQETVAGQNAYVSVAGETNEYLTSQTMYTTKDLTTVFNPTGAKTTQSFYYTGVVEGGHTGYVTRPGITGNTVYEGDTIYTDTWLLTELTEGTKTNYKYTGNDFPCKRALDAEKGDKCINTTTNKLVQFIVDYQNGVPVGSYWGSEDLSTAMGYVYNNALYYYDGTSVQCVQPSPYKKTKDITVTDDTVIRLEDQVSMYNLDMQTDSLLSFDTTYLAQSGYCEFEIFITTNISLTNLFGSAVTWSSPLNLSAGKHLLKIRTFDFETFLGELEVSWV